MAKRDVAEHGAQRPARAAGLETVRDLIDVPLDAWHALEARAIEPSGYVLANWALAVNAFAHQRTDVSVLTAWAAKAPNRLIGLLPVIPFSRAFRLPLPVLINADVYGTLSTPLLDRDAAPEALSAMITQARQRGARALVLFNVSLDGPAMQTLRKVLGANNLGPRVITSHHRACLDATRDAEDVLRDALGSKKLKDLRRQRNRLAEHGDVSFHVARTPDDVAAALDRFLVLEASGWKGTRGTALSQNAGDEAFIRQATSALAARGQCEIVTLMAGATPVASALMVRHLDRAYYFKIGIDERFAKYSPGVQLTLDVTRHLCADPAIASADSTAAPGHPMIDPIWRDRLAIGDVVLPLRPHDPVATLAYAMLSVRHHAREQAKRLIRRLRKR
ncbi:GNAT family N-acetyltransferase [Tardiphaga alba]|uniref:GNAT family N-acetyltransferase n=2 Tax=Tardiphaga alba TaxID=340268 RepID=A0ABX8AGQ9_9BRAD|nr:GNAT family N-acetyltransferase [Tardiphaga alba]